MKATSSRVKIIRKPNKEKQYCEEGCRLHTTNILLAHKSFYFPYWASTVNSEGSPKVNVYPQKAEGTLKERQKVGVALPLRVRYGKKVQTYGMGSLNHGMFVQRRFR